METKLVLADGTEIGSAEVLETANGMLCFFIRSEPQLTLAAAFALMNDPVRTAVIRQVTGSEETVYSGYNALRSIQIDERQISGTLRRTGE